MSDPTFPSGRRPPTEPSGPVAVRVDGGPRDTLKRVTLWAALAVPALLLVALLVGSTTAGSLEWDDDDGPTQGAAAIMFLTMAAAILAVFVVFAAPVAKWGPSGVFLTLGILCAIAGIVVLMGFTVAETTASTLYEGDDDGDGFVDEDGPGDADGSEGNVQEVSGHQELVEHADDDSDGQVDEDPAPVTVTHSEARAVIQAGQQTGIAVMALGVLFIGLFFGLQNLDGRRAPRYH